MANNTSFRFGAILGFGMAIFAAAPTLAQSTDDHEALTELGMRYASGFYLNDPDIVMSTVHTELSKKGADFNFWGIRVEYLSWLQGDRLRLAGRYHDGPEDQFDETTPSEVHVYDIEGDIAVIEMVAANWYDAFTAVRTDDGWRLLDCIWGGIPEYENPSVDAGEAAEVQGVAETFARGVATADRALLDSVIHPNMTMRSFSHEGGVGHVVPVTRESLYLGLSDAAGLVGGDDPLTTTVYNATARTAMARVEHGGARYFVQMLQLRGEWAVVNVTWDPIG